MIGFQCSTNALHSFDDSGGFDYARNKLDEYSNRALDAISIYPDSAVKQSLSDLVSFNALRVK